MTAEPQAGRVAAPDGAQLSPEAGPGETAGDQARWVSDYSGQDSVPEARDVKPVTQFCSSAWGSRRHQRRRLPALAFPG